MGFKASIDILIRHKWAWRRKIVAEWGKESPKTKVEFVSLIKDTKDYRLWLKDNEQKHNDRVDLSKGVVYKGSMF